MPKDCPECEYCCLIGLCCPLEEQRAALTEFFTREVDGATAEDAAKYADAIVAVKAKTHKS